MGIRRQSPRNVLGLFVPVLLLSSFLFLETQSFAEESSHTLQEDALATPAHELKADPKTLPPEIIPLLDTTYPGWRLARHLPSYVTADFDNDGKKDFALQIIQGLIGSEEQDLVLFLNNATGFHLQILESRGVDANIYLDIKKVVESETDLKTGTDKMLSRELLEICGAPEGDRAYRWNGNEMKEVPSPNPNL